VTRRRLAAWLACILAVLAAGVAAGASDPAAARTADPGDLVLSVTDPSGDVQVFGLKGPPKSQRRSADMLGFTVTDEDGSVRFTVVFKRIMPVRKYSQVVDVQLSPGSADDTWFDDINMSPQHATYSRATYSPSLDQDLIPCDPLIAYVDSTAKTISLDVPDVCLPQDAAKIKVYTSFGPYRVEGGKGYSLDKLRVPGQHVLHVIS
jgi:hypothetical protein